MLSGLKPLEAMGINIPRLFGIVYKLDNTADATKFVEHLINESSDEYQMLKTFIPQAVVFKEAVTQQIPITGFSKGNKKQQAKAQKSINAIVALVKELGL